MVLPGSAKERDQHACEFAHLWRILKALLLLIYLFMSRLWLRGPEVNSYFTAGVTECCGLSIIPAISVAAAPAFTELSALDSQHWKTAPPAQHLCAALPPTLTRHPPFLWLMRKTKQMLRRVPWYPLDMSIPPTAQPLYMQEHKLHF